MIRTEKITVQRPRPLDPWIDRNWNRVKTLVVSRIKRTGKPTLRASPEQKQALKKHFSKETRNG